MAHTLVANNLKQNLAGREINKKILIHLLLHEKFTISKGPEMIIVSIQFAHSSFSRMLAHSHNKLMFHFTTRDTTNHFYNIPFGNFITQLSQYFQQFFISHYFYL